MLLADDHPVVRSGYLRLLDQADDIGLVREAGDADAAYAAHAAEPADVLVTDLSMPGGGLELIRRVLQRDPGARILVFGVRDGPLLVRRAFETGARGYLHQEQRGERLVDAVRALHAGTCRFRPASRLLSAEIRSTKGMAWPT